MSDSFTNGTIGEIIKALDISSVQMLAISMPDSRIIDATQCLVRHWGGNKYEMIGRQLSRTEGAPFHAQYVDTGISGIDSSQSRLVEVTHQRPDGQKLSSRFRPKLLRDGSSDFLLLIGSADNEADKSQSKENEARLELAVKAGGYSTWDYSFKTRSGAFHPELHQLLGYDPSQRIVTPEFWDQAVHPEDQGKTLNNLLVTRAPDAPYLRTSYRVRHADGHYVWVELIASLINDPITGQTSKMIGLARDISEEMTARHQIETSEQNLSRSQAIARMGSWVLDLMTNEAELSAQMYALLGIEKTHNPVTLETFIDKFDPKDREKWLQAIGAASKGKQIRALVLDMAPADGEQRRMEIHIDDEQDSKGRIIRLHGICRDVTEQSMLERKYLQAQKMEAVGRLTGGISHDFNNLLMVVLGNLQLVEQLVASDEKISKRLAAAIDAVNKGSELTKRLLAFSRQQSLEDENLDINELVNNMTDIVRRAIGEEIELAVMTGENLWPVSADRTQLETAILNLAINSRHAMKEGGKLTIETANAVLDEDYCAQHADVWPGEYVMIAVTDTGEGIPPELIDKVIQPFFTTKPPESGSGLGLSMIYGFAKQSGGHLKIYSEVGHGTSMRIFLPKLGRKTQGNVMPELADTDLAESGPYGSVLRVSGNDKPNFGNRTTNAAQPTPEKFEPDELPDVVSGASVDVPLADIEPKADHPPADTEPAPSPSLEVAPEHQPLVLIVEDNDAVRDVAVAMIEEMDYRVIDASNGPDALKLIEAHPDIDLMLSDVVMAGMNGPELAQKALAIRPSLKILFASGYTQGSDSEIDKIPTCAELINKPFTQKELTEKVRQAIAYVQAA